MCGVESTGHVPERKGWILLSHERHRYLIGRKLPYECESSHISESSHRGAMTRWCAVQIRVKRDLFQFLHRGAVTSDLDVTFGPKCHFRARICTPPHVSPRWKLCLISFASTSPLLCVADADMHSIPYRIGCVWLFPFGQHRTCRSYRTGVCATDEN